MEEQVDDAAPLLNMEQLDIQSRPVSPILDLNVFAPIEPADMVPPQDDLPPPPTPTPGSPIQHSPVKAPEPVLLPSFMEEVRKMLADQQREMQADWHRKEEARVHQLQVAQELANVQAAELNRLREAEQERIDEEQRLHDMEIEKRNPRVPTPAPRWEEPDGGDDPEDPEDPYYPEDSGVDPEDEDYYPDENPDNWDVPVPKEDPPYEPMPSPPDDPATYASLLQRAATHFNIPLPKQQQSTSFLLDKLGESYRPPASIPVDAHIWGLGTQLMRAPMNTPPTSLRQEKKYKVPDTDHLCLRAQPSPESLVATAARKRSSNPSSLTTVPPEKEARKQDATGKKVLATGALTVKAANSAAVLARYDRDQWDGIAELTQFLPEEKRQEAEAYITEGRLSANNILRATLDLADTGFRQISQGVLLRRQAWLAAGRFPQDIQAKVLNLPFDGENLFGPAADEAMMAVKSEWEAMKAMGILPPRRPRSFRPRGRGSQRGQFQQRQITHQHQAHRGSHTYRRQRRGNGGAARTPSQAQTKQA